MIYYHDNTHIRSRGWGGLLYSAHEVKFSSELSEHLASVSVIVTFLCAPTRPLLIEHTHALLGRTGVW